MQISQQNIAIVHATSLYPVFTRQKPTEMHKISQHREFYCINILVYIYM